MTNTDEPRASVSIGGALFQELAAMARARRTTEAQLMEEAVRWLLQSRSTLPVPRFARRLGPLSIPETD